MNVQPCHSSRCQPQFPSQVFASPEGPLWKDCETFDEAKDLADRSGESYFWTYVYDDSRELLYEAGAYQEHAESLR